MCVQEMQIGMRRGFHNTDNAVHLEAEAMREALHTVTKAEADATRKAVRTESEATRQVAYAMMQVRHPYSFPML